MPLLIAHHLIWTAYGAWLPNDPRGSGSTQIRNPVLQDLGEPHLGRKPIQPASSDIRAFYDAAVDRLAQPPRLFNEEERSLLASVFATVIATFKYTCYAAAIMPDHVHLLIRKHKHRAEEMILNLRSASHQVLEPEDRRRTWSSGHGWKVFLDHPDQVRRTIRYINDNPGKSRLPEQHWNFVTPYDGWPLHPGHSPDSPYARALRDHQE
jgi:REP element-mobilizing transposase RayT